MHERRARIRRILTRAGWASAFATAATARSRASAESTLSGASSVSTANFGFRVIVYRRCTIVQWMAEGVNRQAVVVAQQTCHPGLPHVGEPGGHGLAETSGLRIPNSSGVLSSFESDACAEPPFRPLLRRSRSRRAAARAGTHEQRSPATRSWRSASGPGPLLRAVLHAPGGSVPAGLMGRRARSLASEGSKLRRRGRQDGLRLPGRVRLRRVR